MARSRVAFKSAPTVPAPTANGSLPLRDQRTQLMTNPRLLQSAILLIIAWPGLSLRSPGLRNDRGFEDSAPATPYALHRAIDMPAPAPAADRTTAAANVPDNIAGNR